MKFKNRAGKASWILILICAVLLLGAVIFALVYLAGDGGEGPGEETTTGSNQGTISTQPRVESGTTVTAAPGSATGTVPGSSGAVIGQSGTTVTRQPSTGESGSSGQKTDAQPKDAYAQYLQALTAFQKADSFSMKQTNVVKTKAMSIINQESQTTVDVALNRGKKQAAVQATTTSGNKSSTVERYYANGHAYNWDQSKGSKLRMKQDFSEFEESLKLGGYQVGRDALNNQKTETVQLSNGKNGKKFIFDLDINKMKLSEDSPVQTTKPGQESVLTGCAITAVVNESGELQSLTMSFSLSAKAQGLTVESSIIQENTILALNQTKVTLPKDLGSYIKK